MGFGTFGFCLLFVSVLLVLVCRVGCFSWKFVRGIRNNVRESCLITFLDSSGGHTLLKSFSTYEDSNLPITQHAPLDPNFIPILPNFNLSHLNFGAYSAAFPVFFSPFQSQSVPHPVNDYLRGFKSPYKLYNSTRSTGS